MRLSAVLAVALTSLTYMPSLTAAPTMVRLWSADAPGAKGSAEADIPALSIHPAPAPVATGAGVVVLPGGGYGHLANDHEGLQIAAWLNQRGISAFVLRYRLGPKYNHPVELHDAQRALRYVRHNAKQWGVAPAKIGIWGFSAGGHLASTVGTHFDKGNPAAPDAVDRESSRPDFMILSYPVITLVAEEYVHKGSRRNLLGETPDPKLAASLSSETKVSPETPPTFLFATDEDAAVPAENSVLFYLALRKAKVPAELHIYEKGRHGVGLAQQDRILSTWSARLEDWLRVRQVLPAI